MIREVVPPDTGSVFRAMQALRSNLEDEASFVRAVDEAQRPEGYRLVGVFEGKGSEVVAVAGFRAGHNLAWGHYLYVTISRPCRRRGAAGTVGRCSTGWRRRGEGSAAISSISTRASASTAPMPTGST